MSLLSLVVAPDIRLLTKSTKVDKVDKELQLIMDSMLETMYHEDGAGLAAVQIGVMKRVMVIDIESKNASKPIFLINPEITFLSEQICTLNEGCLSFPEQRLDIERPEFLTVNFLDYDGNQKSLDADGWLARAVLHELDHLNGVVMPDYASKLKKDMMMKKAAKIKKIQDI